MGLFDKFISESFVSKPPSYGSNKKAALELIDRAVEKIADNVNYDVGDKIRKVHNTVKSVGNPFEAISENIPSNKSILIFKEEPKIGDHIYVNRGLYSHHGIYIGAGQVIHYTGTPDNIENATIQEDSIETFLNGGELLIKDYAFKKREDWEIVLRAESRLGEREYNLLNNNCQNFAEWCINGE